MTVPSGNPYPDMGKIFSQLEECINDPNHETNRNEVITALTSYLHEPRAIHDTFFSSALRDLADQSDRFRQLDEPFQILVGGKPEVFLRMKYIVNLCLHAIDTEAEITKTSTWNDDKQNQGWQQAQRNQSIFTTHNGTAWTVIDAVGDGDCALHCLLGDIITSENESKYQTRESFRAAFVERLKNAHEDPKIDELVKKALKEHLMTYLNEEDPKREETIIFGEIQDIKNKPASTSLSDYCDNYLSSQEKYAEVKAKYFDALSIQEYYLFTSELKIIAHLCHLRYYLFSPAGDSFQCNDMYNSDKADWVPIVMLHNGVNHYQRCHIVKKSPLFPQQRPLLPSPPSPAAATVSQPTTQPSQQQEPEQLNFADIVPDDLLEEKDKKDVAVLKDKAKLRLQDEAFAELKIVALEMLMTLLEKNQPEHALHLIYTICHESAQSNLFFDQEKDALKLTTNEKFIPCISKFAKSLSKPSNDMEAINFLENCRILQPNWSDGTILATESTCAIPLPNNCLAVGSSDGSVTLWDLNSSKKIGHLNLHQGPIHTLFLLPNHRLASGTLQDVVIWDLNTCEALFHYPAKQPNALASIQLLNNSHLILFYKNAVRKLKKGSKKDESIYECSIVNLSTYGIHQHIYQRDQALQDAPKEDTSESFAVPFPPSFPVIENENYASFVEKFYHHTLHLHRQTASSHILLGGGSELYTTNDKTVRYNRQVNGRSTDTITIPYKITNLLPVNEDCFAVVTESGSTNVYSVKTKRIVKICELDLIDQAPKAIVFLPDNSIISCGKSVTIWRRQWTAKTIQLFGQLHDLEKNRQYNKVALEILSYYQRRELWKEIIELLEQYSELKNREMLSFYAQALEKTNPSKAVAVYLDLAKRYPADHTYHMSAVKLLCDGSEFNQKPG